MKITCISAANVEGARHHSASTRTCELIAGHIQARKWIGEIEILPLIDYEMKPCRMCGQCFATQRCSRDEAYNQVFEKLTASDALFFVIPHYAPFPSKIMILLEKLEELAYLKYCSDPQYVFPLAGKPAGLIVHGGQTEEALPYYKNSLLDPLAAAFSAAQLKIIGADEQNPNGVVFGIRQLTKPADSIFVEITHDWDTINARILPLVEKVIETIGLG